MRKTKLKCFVVKHAQRMSEEGVARLCRVTRERRGESQKDERDLAMTDERRSNEEGKVMIERKRCADVDCDIAEIVEYA